MHKKLCKLQYLDEVGAIILDEHSQSFNQSVVENMKQPNTLDRATTLFGIIAWILTLVANFTCSWFTVDIMIHSYDYFIGFGMWSYEGWSYIPEGGGAIYYTQACDAYDGYQVSPDSEWITARAFSIIAGKC